MKRNLSFASAAFAILLLFSCQKQTIVDEPQTQPSGSFKSIQADKYNVFKGPEVPLGNGYARSWVRINHLDQPSELGVEITAAAMTSLPSMHTELVLPLHKKAIASTPFEHIGLNYQPNGHPPAGVFNVPHFDAHFYLITNEERQAIPAVSPSTMPLFTLAPPAGYMPPTYTMGAPEPRMGSHWAPPPPTFIPFSRVMIYGTFNGEITFVEPMVTVAHMLSGGSSQSFLQPSKFAEAGNYPTWYNVYTENGNYNVTLSQFVSRPAN